jgi:site-specific recombinase XerD
MSKYFAVLKQRAGIDKPLTPHILRHTYCTNLLQNGADITYIKELAGHADIQTTAKYYLGVDRKALRSVVARFLNYKTPPPVDTNSGQS